MRFDLGRLYTSKTPLWVGFHIMASEGRYQVTRIMKWGGPLNAETIRRRKWAGGYLTLVRRGNVGYSAKLCMHPSVAASRAPFYKLCIQITGGDIRCGLEEFICETGDAKEIPRIG